MGQRKKRKRWIIAFAIILVVAISLAALFFNPKKGLKLVLPNLDDITLVNATIKNDTAYVGINMVLENKSMFKLNLDTLFYKITLADSLLFNQTQILTIRQKPGQVNTIELPLKIPVSKTTGTIKSLQKQDSTYLDIHAYIVYNTLFGSKKIPVSKKVRIKVPVPPEIKVKQVEITKVNLNDKTVDLSASVTIINKGDMLDLNIHEVHYSIVLGDKLVTSDGVYNKPISIKPASETGVIIPITVKVNKIAKVAWKFLVNDEVAYRIDIKARLDENSFYQKSNIPVQAKAEGKARLRKK